MWFPGLFFSHDSVQRIYKLNREKYTAQQKDANLFVFLYPASLKSLLNSSCHFFNVVHS